MTRSRSPRGSAVAHALAALLVAVWVAVPPHGASAQADGSAVDVARGPIALPPPEDVPLVPARPAGELGIGTHLSVVLVEAGTGQVLVASDATTRRPVASAIKLVTALAVVDAIVPGASVTVGDEVRGIEGSSFRLRPGETRSVEDLLAGLLLRSGNDAAVALAVAVAGSEEAFTTEMREVLARLGIDAHPASASGLEEGDALSALELATVARAALAEPRIRIPVGLPVLVLADGSEVENRNAFLTDVADATGLKTGFTNAAGFTLAASAERDGRALVAVVLGARDDRERRDTAVRLLEHGYAATAVTELRGVLTLRTASGPVEFRVDLGPVTFDRAAGPRLLWAPDVRPTDTTVRVVVGVGERTSEPVDVVRADGRATSGPTGLGRALVDGVYAGLRPVALGEVAGSGTDALR